MAQLSILCCSVDFESTGSAAENQCPNYVRGPLHPSWTRVLVTLPVWFEEMQLSCHLLTQMRPFCLFRLPDKTDHPKTQQS